MRWSEIPWNPSPRTLRQFAGIWLVFLGLLAAREGLVRDNTPAALVLAVLALSVGLLGLAKPGIIRPLFVGSMILTFPIGWLVSKLLLALVYYVLFTPIGWFFRLIGRDALARRRDPAATTYWLPKPPPVDSRSYFRQFS
jgi:hypothetical protein